MTAVPARWRSVLPSLGYDLPEDLPADGPDRSDWPGGPDSPGATDSPFTGVRVNLPLELARQSRSGREFWPVPEPVLDQYRRFRPTPLWHARDFGAAVGARVPIYVKYEGGNVSGSHKLNTALAQAYYYRQAGVRELVTGTGAGQWGTALAAACALFGLRCTVFMVEGSLRRKPYRGTLMRLLGASVHASPSPLTEVGRRHGEVDGGGNSLALAIGEAVAYAGERDGSAFSIGSGENYTILHQSVIGLEAVDQLAAMDATVDAVVGCVGAGSNFGGVSLPFFSAVDGGPGPLLLAAESTATPKLTRGVYAYDRTDATGSGPREAMYTIGSDFTIPASHSAGLRFHAASKLLSAMRHRGQIAATAVGQAEAMSVAHEFVRHEGVLPAPESGHALAAAVRLATDGVTDREVHHRVRSGVLVCLSGHGYLDLSAYQQHLAHELADEAPDDSVLLSATAGLCPAVPAAIGGSRVG